MCPHHISDGLEDNELPCYLGRAYRSMLQVLNGERPLPIERTIQINPTEACSPDDYMDWVWRRMRLNASIPDAYLSLLQTIRKNRPFSIDSEISQADLTNAVVEWAGNYVPIRSIPTGTAIIPALRIMDQWPITDSWASSAAMGLDEAGRHAVDNAFSKATRTTYNRSLIPPKHTKKRRRHH